MATLGDLKARIISETLRDDLADDLATQLDNTIRKSIEVFANEAWWFNETRTPGALTVGQQLQPIPIGWHRISDIWLIIGGVRYPLGLRQLGEIEELYSVPMVGQPTDYAVFGENIFIWPTPNQAYPVMWNLIADVSPPLVDDTSSNIWTNTGQDLICAQAKLRLYRDYLSANLQDPRIMGAKNAVDEAYENLRAESNRKMTSGRVRAGW